MVNVMTTIKNLPPSVETPFDPRDLTYGNSFSNPVKRIIIQTVELFTGRIKLMRLIRRHEKDPNRAVHFWSAVLHHLDIKLTTPMSEIKKIPSTGPVLVVANHPHGLVDGVVIADLISQVRTDYKVMTRSILCTVPEIKDELLPVYFPHEEGAIKKNIETRRVAVQYLKDGGCMALFPAGTVATSGSWFGPAEEKDWNTFTAKMIFRSGATVIPVRFQTQNTRAFQIANLTSTTLRQSLLLHEIVQAMHKPQRPIIGDPIPASKIAEFDKDPKGLVAYLRQVTLALKVPE